MERRATYALRYLAGDRKIHAIKLVRELTELGLEASKDIVDDQQVFLDGLDQARALEIVARFEEFGSQVAMIAEARHWYGFDPQHPARGDQPLIRLRAHGPSLAWERGRIGAWTHEREQAFDDLEALDHALERELARWAEQGLESSERELDIVQRSSAREPTLEAAIRVAEAPDEAMRVYADWLQRQGDPRGLVAALDLARSEAESTPTRERLDQAFAATLLEHHAHLFGPLVEQELGGLRWSGGHVIELELAHQRFPDSPRSDLERLELLLGLPICACLRSLKIRARIGEGSAFETYEPTLLAGLRELVLDSVRASVTGLLDDSRLPRLERLELSGVRFSPLRLSKLQTLALTLWSYEWILDELRASSLPRLRTLALHFFGDDDFGWPPLEQLLALPLVASLDTLTLRDLGDEPWPIELAQTLIDATNLRGVGRIDLSAIAFSDAAYAALVEAQPRLPNFVLGPSDD